MHRDDKPDGSPAGADALVLDDGRSRAVIHPAQGGAVGRFDVRLGGRLRAIFQTRADAGRVGPFALGCNPLAPFSNRISGGGFRHAGRFHALAPNLPHSRYPTHGNALTSRWRVDEAHPDRAILGLESDGPGPFRYGATLSYALADGALAMELHLRSGAEMPLPFGVGFHPWFVRTPATRLTLAACGYWSEDAEHLPEAFHPAGTGAFDFGRGARLPTGWINVAFTGWTGRARIDWPERGLSVTIAAEPPLTTAIVYAPSPDRSFFCVEPVSHSVDAHNRSDPDTAPPQVLAPGETLSARALFTVVDCRPAEASGARGGGRGRL